MPHGNHAANDGYPTLDEIIQILKYQDVRVKTIILMMISSLALKDMMLMY